MYIHMYVCICIVGLFLPRPCFGWIVRKLGKFDLDWYAFRRSVIWFIAIQIIGRFSTGSRDQKRYTLVWFGNQFDNVLTS